MICPLCRSDAAPTLVMRTATLPLVRCPRCRLVRVDPMPTSKETLAQYDDTYFRNEERGYVHYLEDEAVFRAEFRRRLHTLRAAGARGKLLDVGCATGALLREARALHFDPSGLEPSQETAAIARERSQCPVQTLSLEAAVFARATYDVIVMFDVLEHVADPVAAATKLRRALKPGGIFAVTVPDYGGWWARASGRYWPMITPWEHLVYFTRETVRATLHAAGLEGVHFHQARTPMSWGSMARHVPLLHRFVPRSLAHRGTGLPFGSLFVLANAPRIGGGESGAVSR